MKPNILTRERLAVIWRAIDKNGGKVSVRHLMRNHGLFRSVIDEAIDAGFLTLETHKPARGRPSQVLKKVSVCYPTKLPPSHFDLDRLISSRHRKFAFHYAFGEIGPGLFDFKRRAWVAYKKSFPSARSDRGARASASRLRRKPHIHAAIAWIFAKYHDSLQYTAAEPQTESEIWEILFKTKSYFFRWAPWWIRQQWERQEADSRLA